MNITTTPLRKAKGSVLVLTAIAIALLVGMGSLAIDLSHAYTNKTRLQNLADALALSAAISLNKGEKSVAYPDEEAFAQNYASTNTFPAYTASLGNQEVLDGISTAELDFTFAQDWSSNPADWHAANGISKARFARVTVNSNNSAANFMLTWFANLFAFNQIVVSTSAVAGPIPAVPCNIIPMMMCGQTDNRNVDAPDGDGVDRDCTNDNDDNDYVDYLSPTYSKAAQYNAAINDIDGGTPGTEDGNKDCYGYELNVVYQLKWQKENGMPGNFSYFESGSGGSATRECMAGDTACTVNVCKDFAETPSGLQLEVVSEPGQKVGPVAQGLNTRFDDFSGPVKYPDYKPDSNVLGSIIGDTKYDWRWIFHEFDQDNGIKIQTEKDDPSPPLAYTSASVQQFNKLPSPPNYNPDYLTRTVIDSGSGHSFIRGRRLISVPLVSCKEQNGKKPFEILGFGCLFLTHTVKNTGNDSANIYGEFLDADNCKTSGEETSGANFDFYKVILYKDPFGAHS